MRKILVLMIVLSLIGICNYPVFGFNEQGARALGMSGAFTAVADDGTAPYWNPAGITQVKLSINAGLTAISQKYSFWIPSFVGVTTKNLAVNLSSDIHKYIEYYDVNGNSYMEESQHTIFIGTTAFSIGNFLAIGGNFKLISLSESVVDGTTLEIVSGIGSVFSYDLGLLLKPFLNDTIRIGLVGKNLNNPTINIENGMGTINGVLMEPFNETASYLLGIAVKPADSTIIATDFEKKLNSESIALHAGLEQTFLWDIITLRVGATYSDLNNMGNSPQISGGVGLKLGSFSGDAALININNREGSYNFAFSCGFKF